MTNADDPSPASWPLLLQRGVDKHRAGALPAAEWHYRRVLDLFPDQPDAINLLGIIALQTGDIASAVSLGRRACILDPEQASYHLSLGNALRGQRQFASAAEEFSAAIRLRPGYAEAHNNLGLARMDLQQHDSAIAAFRQAIALDPSAQAWTNLASALRRSGQIEEAAAAARAAIAADPASALAHNALGNCLLDRQQIEPAIAAFHAAISIDPASAEAYTNLCIAEYRAGRYEEAIAAGRAAVGLAPDLAAAHWNLAHALLITGDLREGFAGYEWRSQLDPPIARPPAFPTRWLGQPLAGKVILLQSEQGLGDTLQFIRCAKPLADRGAAVVLQCPPPLSRLLARAPGISAVTDHADLAADFFCLLMSLPHLLGTTLHSIPADIPYLFAPGDFPPLGARHDFPQVGVAWAGAAHYANDRHRSIPLSALEPLSAIKNLALHSLQIGPAAAQLRDMPHMPIQDHADNIRDFADTAALIAQLDVVIAVDTAVAHLAGAMGKPTWLLLPRVPDWRWMRDRSDSPWYPTMRLFRQSRQDDWSSVIDRVVKSLAELPHAELPRRKEEKQAIRDNGL